MADRRVVLDTDFIGGITGYQAGDGADLFRRTFQTLDRHPVIHPYVAEYELMNNAIAQELIKSEDIAIIPYSDFLEEHGVKRILYRKSFQDLHTIIREERPPRKNGTEMTPLKPDEDVFRRQAGRSFGEIHSILMAVELEIPLFFSNDGGARTAALRFRKGRLTVKNAEEVAELLRLDGGQVTGDERRFIGHFYTRQKH